jgi:sialate O-acetylesterase
MTSTRLITAAASLLALSSAMADVKLAPLFTDNMMLQRDKPVRIWGTADAAEAVSVTLAGKTAATKADAAGAWIVELPALSEGTALELQVKGNNELALKNIIMGDIWVCSGQSNMEMTLNGCLGAAQDIAAADLPDIRHIKFKRANSVDPQVDPVVEKPWQECSPKTAAGFTAAGFYFAREVQKQTGVPIGLISTNWGGTRIELWTPQEGFALVPEIAPKIPAKPKVKSPTDKDPSELYNAMVHPIIRFPIKGVIWYQGEQNGSEADPYRLKMQALIGSWRKNWNLGDFPFYFVQLANFQAVNEDPSDSKGWAKLREAQLKSLALPNTGMAVIIDTVPLDAAAGIHPKNKYDVGTRLAYWALARDYGKNITPSGPLFKASTVEGDKIRVSFDHLGAGLMAATKEGRNPAAEAPGAPLKRFAIAGADKKWFWADAVIQKDTVIVSSPQVKSPVAVRYAFQMNPDGANLYNKDGLPASPFRTDEW